MLSTQALEAQQVSNAAAFSSKLTELRIPAIL